MINARVGRTSDPKYLPHYKTKNNNTQDFQLLNQMSGVVHNHPSGDPTPSQADIEMTRRIIDAARVFDIQVHDHVIVGREGTKSFRALGLM